jgi:peptide-methionine (S)-S-oxide reductase
VFSFGDLLHVFFTIHDPTTLNRQGADVGTQYRSAIFYHTPEQKAIAEQKIKDLNADHLWPNPIVTEVTPFTEFFPAEDYHQEYFAHNPNQGYCQFVIAPKVGKFRKQYFERLKA